jgi:hypothetical protein
MKDSRHINRYIALFFAGLAYAFPVAWYWTAKPIIEAHLTFRDTPPPCVMCFYQPTKVEVLMLKCMLYAFALSLIGRIFYAAFLRDLSKPYPKIYSIEYVFVKLPYHQLTILVAVILLIIAWMLLQLPIGALEHVGVFIASFF